MDVQSLSPEPAVAAAVDDRTQKCEAIEAAALELFVEQGFHGTTVPEIARRAGVGTGTLYLYHASKDELLEALFLRWDSLMIRDLLASHRDGMTPREMFAAHWQGAVRFGDTYPAAWAFLMAYHGSPYVGVETRRRLEAMKAPLVAVFETGIAERVFKPLPPELLRAVCLGLLREVRELAVQGKITMTPALWQAAESMAWEAISL